MLDPVITWMYVQELTNRLHLQSYHFGIKVRSWWFYAVRVPVLVSIQNAGIGARTFGVLPPKLRFNSKNGHSMNKVCFLALLSFLHDVQLKGHWTSITSSPNIFSKKVGILISLEVLARLITVCWHE